MKQSKVMGNWKKIIRCVQKFNVGIGISILIEAEKHLFYLNKLHWIAVSVKFDLSMPSILIWNTASKKWLYAHHPKDILYHWYHNLGNNLIFQGIYYWHSLFSTVLFSARFLCTTRSGGMTQLGRVLAFLTVQDCWTRRPTIRID